MPSIQQVTLEEVLKKLRFPHAKWRATGQAVAEYEGTCQKCGNVGPAVNLELKRLPFGRGEIWACKGDCE